MLKYKSCASALAKNSLEISNGLQKLLLHILGFGNFLSESRITDFMFTIDLNVYSKNIISNAFDNVKIELQTQFWETCAMRVRRFNFRLFQGLNQTLVTKLKSFLNQRKA